MKAVRSSLARAQGDHEAGGGWLLREGGRYLVTDDIEAVRSLRGETFIDACEAAECWDETELAARAPKRIEELERALKGLRDAVARMADHERLRAERRPRPPKGLLCQSCGGLADLQSDGKWLCADCFFPDLTRQGALSVVR